MKAAGRYKIIFWDWGRVRGDFDYDEFILSLARLFLVSPYHIVSFLDEGEPSTFDQLECGWSEEKIHQEFVKRFGYVPLESFIQRFCSGVKSKDYRHVDPLLDRIAASGVKQGMISNINCIHAGHIVKTDPDSFRHIPSELRFFSFELGCKKPDVFPLVFDRCQVKPEECIFFDDLEENVRGFNALGGKGFIFYGFFDAEAELIKLGVI